MGVNIHGGGGALVQTRGISRSAVEIKRTIEDETDTRERNLIGGTPRRRRATRNSPSASSQKGGSVESERGGQPARACTRAEPRRCRRRKSSILDGDEGQQQGARPGGGAWQQLGR